MPPPWAPASPCWPSAWSIAAVRFRSLDDPAGQCAPCLAPRVAAPAAATAARHPQALDGHRAGRSWPVCRLAVSPYRPVGVASVFAHQPRGDLSPGPAGHLPPVAELRAPARDTLAGRRHRLQRSPAAPALHTAGLLGRGVPRPLADPDRSAARRQRGGLVWPAAWDEQQFKCIKRAGWQWGRTR